MTYRGKSARIIALFYCLILKIYYKVCRFSETQHYFLLYNFSMVKSAYVHIPFCKSKCHYCSFVSFNKLDLKKDYIKALLKEIEFNYQGEVLNTLYFGGGTPSVLEYTDFAQILRKLKTNSNTEITTELNPEGVSYD